MTTGDKAKRATVAIGPLSVDGFQMSDGSYRMNITSAAEAVGTSQQNGSNYLCLNAFKALQVSSYTPQTSDQGKAYAEPDALAPTAERAVTRVFCCP